MAAERDLTTVFTGFALEDSPVLGYRPVIDKTGQVGPSQIFMTVQGIQNSFQ